MDDTTRKMVAEAYDETLDEALLHGEGDDRAHREAVTAAAMFYASLSGVDDGTARATIEALFQPQH